METIMCIYWKSNKLGCSYYSSANLELLVMEDVKELKDFEYLTMLIAQILPKLIIISDLSDEPIFHFIEEEYGTSIEIKKVLGKDFSFEKGRYMLLNWYIDHIQQMQQPHNYDLYGSNVDMEEDISNATNQNIFLMDPEEGNRTHAYLQLEGVIQLDNSRLTVGCAGVLLKHLQKVEQEEGMMNSEDGRAGGHDLSIQPIALQSFSCELCMHVNCDTIKSLCIFDYETHPNMHQKHAKESLSLFGLLNKTSSVLGKQLLSEWVSRPTRDKHILDYRHEAICFFLQSDKRDAIQELSHNLKHIKNIHRLMARVKGCKASSNDWQYILKFAYYTNRIFGLLHRVQHSNPNLAFMKKAMHFMPVVETMKLIQSSITNIIDFESSKAEGRIIVKEGIDGELDVLRKKYESLDNFLLQVSQEISAVLPVELGATMNVVYFPQLGYLITLPQYHRQRNSTAGDNSNAASSNHVSEYYAHCLSGFELQFTTLENMYYKNEKTKELDENIGDIHAMIADKEIEIIQELSKYILQYASQLSDTVKILSELDCILSLTMVALRFNYVQPTMTLDNSLIIIQGRHPLQELCVDTFIPNDTNLKGGRGLKSTKKNEDHISSYFESSTSYLINEKEQSSFSNSIAKDSSISKLEKIRTSNKAIEVNNTTLQETIAPRDSSDRLSIKQKFGASATGKPINTGNADRKEDIQRGPLTMSEPSIIIKDTENSKNCAQFITSCTNQGSTILSQQNESSVTNRTTSKYDIAEDVNSVQVVTGANFSGKSVYLKQIALIVYMAHVGSFVPANQAVIGITDKLFTRIQTSETVSKPQSAFASDLQQLYRALNNFTSRSLIIIDEFGKGTDSSDGAALFCSVIGYYLSKGDQCPKIVASTHFHDLISQDILSTQDGITLSQTEILSSPHRNKEKGEGEAEEEEGDEVVFLYRIVPGKGPNASYGIWCASIAGLPSSTIKRAIELSQTYISGKPINRVNSEQDEENFKVLDAIKDDFLHTELDFMDPHKLITSIETLFKKDD